MDDALPCAPALAPVSRTALARLPRSRAGLRPASLRSSRRAAPAVSFGRPPRASFEPSFERWHCAGVGDERGLGPREPALDGRERDAARGGGFGELHAVDEAEGEGDALVGIHA